MLGRGPAHHEPSARAKAAFWLGIVNSGGLMLLGAYCLKGAVDHQALADGLVTVAALYVPILHR